jgi:hypothetical protein
MYRHLRWADFKAGIGETGRRRNKWWRMQNIPWLWALCGSYRPAARLVEKK